MASLFLPAAAAALLLLPPPTLAYDSNCYYNSYGNYVCDNYLASGARIGIGIGIAVLVILLFACFTWHRRRRVRAQNVAYLQQQQAFQQQAGSYPQGPPPPPPPPQGGMGWGYGPSGWRGGFGTSGVNANGQNNLGSAEQGAAPGSLAAEGEGGYVPPPPAYQPPEGGTTYPPKTYQGPGQYLPPTGAPPENYDPTNAQNYPNRR